MTSFLRHQGLSGNFTLYLVRQQPNIIERSGCYEDALDREKYEKIVERRRT